LFAALDRRQRRIPKDHRSLPAQAALFYQMKFDHYDYVPQLQAEKITAAG
jgi:hypothetical protein